MKCIFVIEQDVNPATMAESERAKVKFRPCLNKNLRGKVVEKALAFFPVGTAYEHPHAAWFVQAGSAIPGDEECWAAVREAGITEEELAARQHEYRRNDLGIRPEHIPLYNAGVISGYDADSPDGLAHTELWPAYEAALKEAEEQAEKELMDGEIETELEIVSE